MPCDRFGKPVKIFWEPHQDLWARAARSLRPAERWEAYKQIAEMVGRTPEAVAKRGGLLLSRERREAKEWLQTNLRKNWASEASTASPRKVLIRCPTMSSNARLAPAWK